MYPYGFQTMFYRQGATANPYSQYPMQNRQTQMGDMTIEGKSTINTKPDMALVTLGVVTNGSEVTDVQQENNQIMEQILENLKKYGIDDEQIQTIQYRVYPKYDYIDGKQILKGYELNNTIQVTVTDLSNLNDIVVTSIKLGANSSQGVTFTLSNLEEVYEEALNQAILNGQIKAQNLANTLGVNLLPTPVSNIEKTQDDYGPLPKAAYSDSSGTIQPGTIDISASVIQKYLYEIL